MGISLCTQFSSPHLFIPSPICGTPIPLSIGGMALSKSEPEKHTVLNGRDRELEPMDVRSDAGSSTSTLYDNMESEEKLQKIDVEQQGSPPVGKPKEVRTSRVQLMVWMIVNTLATIAIVSNALPPDGDTRLGLKHRD